MKTFNSLVICIAMMIVGCRTNESSQLAGDKEVQDFKMKKLEVAKVEFLVEKHRRQSLETALAVFHLEEQTNRKFDKEAFEKTFGAALDGGSFRSAVSTTAGVLAVGHLIYSSMFYTGGAYYFDREIRSFQSTQSGLGTASSLGLSIYSGIQSFKVSDEIKLSEKQMAELSEQLQTPTFTKEFDIICSFLGLSEEDKRELQGAFRKKAVEYFDLGFWRTSAEISARLFYQKLDTQLQSNFLEVAKAFTPARGSEEYQQKLKTLETFIDAVAIANKLIDEKNKEYIGTETVSVRLDILRAYRDCLEVEQKALAEKSLDQSELYKKRSKVISLIEGQIKTLTALEAMIPSDKK